MAKSVFSPFGPRGLTAAMAFLTRSVRQDSRLVSHHGLRAAMALLILFLFFAETQTSAIRSAVGAVFAGSVVHCCYWFLTLLGGIHFSSAISEEKDEQTLALLKMTGASSFSILIGKSLPRLAVAILFLAVIVPFLLLAITLGGVLRSGLLSAIIGILCYSVMLCQLGLFAGVVSSSTKKSFSLICILWLLFEFPVVWWGFLSATLGYFFGVGSPELFAEAYFFLSQAGLYTNLSSDLQSFSPTEIWHTHMTVQLGVAVVFFALSWIMFEPCTSRAVGEGKTIRSGHRWFASGRAAGRVWNNAAMWKSWQFNSGGLRWLLIRFFLGPVLIFGAGAFFSMIDGSQYDIELVIAWGLTLGIGFLLITIARLLGRVFNEEIHENTLAGLVMLPQKESSTFWSLIGGLLPAIGAAAFTAVFSFVLLIGYALVNVSSSSSRDIAEVFLEPWGWHFFSWIIVTAHVGVLLTTYVRYGGMLISVAICWFLTPMVCMVSFGLLAFTAGPGFGNGSWEFLQYLVPLFLIFVEALCCMAIQRSVHKRLIELAGK